MAQVGPVIAMVLLAALLALVRHRLRTPPPPAVRTDRPARPDYGLLVPVAVVRTRADALARREQLRSAGIRSTLANSPDGWVLVLVFAEEVARARRLMG